MFFNEWDVFNIVYSVVLPTLEKELKTDTCYHIDGP